MSLNADKYFDIVDNFKAIENIPVIKIKEARNTLPFFTIAIPTYKRAELLEETLNSALSQKGNVDYNILVVDNNPERDDDTEKLLSTYENYRLSYYKNSYNIGMVGNWNRLYTLAQGRYIVMLHDDDLLFPNYLKYIYQTITKSNLDVNNTAAYYVPYIKGKSTCLENKYHLFQNPLYKIKQLKLFDFIGGNILGAPTGLCLRRDDAIELGGFDSHFYPSSDYYFYVKLVYHKKILKLEGDPLLFYRISDNESAKKETLLGFITADLKIKRGILSISSLLNQKIWNNYIQTHSYYFLISGMKIWNNHSFDAKEELKTLGFSYNIVNKVLYKIMNFFYRLTRKINNLDNKKSEIIRFE
jgi:glycosyltransferase involved in cell wall biosynthesis